MAEKIPSNHNKDDVKAAEALYGAINSAFEDWESREIPPNGYAAQFHYDIPVERVRDVQTHPNLSLRQLGIHDLRSPARWALGIGIRPALGRLGISGLSLPLATAGQRLIFRYENTPEDTFSAYLGYQDQSDTLLMRSPVLDSSYIRELLDTAGVKVPDLDLPPHNRTLALAKIANQASVFEIIQRKSMPVHTTQEVTFEKVTSRNEPKESSQMSVPKKTRKKLRGSRQKPTQGQYTYESSLRAIYKQINEAGQPLYGQIVTFEGSGATVSKPTVELLTYRVNDLTGAIEEEKVHTTEQISSELLGMIESGLFDINYGGEDPQPGGY